MKSSLRLISSMLQACLIPCIMFTLLGCQAESPDPPLAIEQQWEDAFIHPRSLGLKYLYEMTLNSDGSISFHDCSGRYQQLGAGHRWQIDSGDCISPLLPSGVYEIEIDAEFMYVSQQFERLKLSDDVVERWQHIDAGYLLEIEELGDFQLADACTGRRSQQGYGIVYGWISCDGIEPPLASAYYQETVDDTTLTLIRVFKPMTP